MPIPKSIAITGASSGIGRQLAIDYAAPDVTLFLSGRNQERLEETAHACRTQGASVFSEVFDAADKTAATAFIDGAERKNPLDLVVANAGTSERARSLTDFSTVAQHTFSTNVDGVFNILHPAIPYMAARRKGQLAIVSSLASFQGLPGALAYAASKAAVRVYGEGLRARLGREGIAVSVICPGYIETPMTAKNRFKMPFLMDTQKASRIIRRGLEQNQGRIAFPGPMYGLVMLGIMTPRIIVDAFAARWPDK